jgi:hypothetical protein
MELLHYPDQGTPQSAGDSPDSAMINSGMGDAEFGIGAYSLTEAGRLLRVSPTTIRRCCSDTAMTVTAPARSRNRCGGRNTG